MSDECEARARVLIVFALRNESAEKNFFTRSSRHVTIVRSCVCGDIWRWRAELATFFFFFSEAAAAATLRPSDVKAQQSATWARVAAREE